MIHVKFLLMLCLAAMAYGDCYDSIKNKVYRTGDEYTRIKIMEGSTLKGEYRCRCFEGGMIRCNATDIPCKDFKSHAWVPKGEQLRAKLIGRIYRCTCMGGRARLTNCTAINTDCWDLKTLRRVKQGEWYTMHKFHQYLECQCGPYGEPMHQSCSPTSINRSPTVVRQQPCIDIETYRPVRSGSFFTTSERGVRKRCLCDNGIPLRCSPLTTSYTRRAKVVRLPQPQPYPAQRYYPVPKPRYYFPSQQPRPRPFPRPIPRPVEPVEEEEEEEDVIDPCLEGILSCDDQAECVPDGTSFSCVCVDGFTGDGNTCSDVNECLTNGACDENAVCENTVGSHGCTCKLGYRGDGHSCQKMCQDDVTKAYVPDGDTLVTVTNGRKRLCACLRGEINEHSCVDVPAEEQMTTLTPETTTKVVKKIQRCRSDSPRFYHKGESFVRFYRGTRFTCVCELDKSANKRNKNKLVSRCSET